MSSLVASLAKVPTLALLFLSASSVVTGDLFAKYWSMTQRPLHLALAVAGYFFSGFFYIPSLLKEGLVVTSVIWSVLSIVGFLLIGIVLFKEHLTLLQTAGAVLGIVSLVLLSATLN